MTGSPCQLTTSTVPPIPEPICCLAIEAGKGQRLFTVDPQFMGCCLRHAVVATQGKNISKPSGWLSRQSSS
jgi:hypothetical protein